MWEGREHATRLLWVGAGKPEVAGVEVFPAACWWCGLPLSATAPREAVVPSSWPDWKTPAKPASTRVCAACAWTFSDRVQLPRDLAAGALRRRLQEGGRVEVSWGGDPELQKVIGLRLQDGRVGLWSRGRNAAGEAPWLAAREALRSLPGDVGPCCLLAVVADEDLGTGTARFRNYDHVGTGRMWWPLSKTAEGKAELRAFLLAPPPEPWVAVVGDGQKHGAAYAPVADPEPCAYVVGAGLVRWRPGELALWLLSFEALMRAGAGADEIVSGRYARMPHALRVAMVSHEPVVDSIRGSARMDLVCALRWSVAQMKEAAT